MNAGYTSPIHISDRGDHSHMYATCTSGCRFRFGIVTLTECPATFRHGPQSGSPIGREGRECRSRASCAEMVRQVAGAHERKEELDTIARLGPPLQPDLYNRGTQPSQPVRASCPRRQPPTAPPAPRRATRGLSRASGKTAVVDRAVLDALLRLLGVSLFDAANANVFGLTPALTPDLAGFDIERPFLGSLRAGGEDRPRHTVGLLDPNPG